MTAPEPDSLDWLRNRRGGTPDAAPGCLDDDTIAALAEGSLAAPAREAALAHLASCARCRTAVASVAHALSDPDVHREAAAAEVSRRARWKVLVPVAAAAALLVALLPLGVFRPGVDGPHRGPAGEVPPTALEPAGDVASARLLRWSSVPGAAGYRATIFDPEGRVVYETGAADTVASVPDSVPLRPGGRYLWKVEARMDIERWVASPMVEFTLAGGARR